jgi:outer membrane protein TolC
MSNRVVAVLLLLLALAISFCGCRDIGRGGTGEVVVARQTLRQIDSSTPADFGRPSPVPPTTLPSTRATTQPLEKVELTLADVRELALRNNLDLEVERIAPSLARESLNAEEARYEALFTTDVNYASNDSPSANTVTQAQTGTQSNSWSIAPGVQFPLRTGGLVQFDVPMSRFETNTAAQTLNPTYTSDVVARISQPLLRGGGIDVNAQPIRVAFYGYQQAQARAKLEMIRVLANVDRVYWQLFAAREALRVRRQEYDLAVAQLDRARRMARAGQSAEVETVRAQSGVADRVEAIINAENLLRDRERDLKRMLNTPDLDMQSRTELVPGTPPQPMYLQLDVPHLVALAMDRRMELLDTELQIALETASIRVARHELLPLVNVD